MILIEILIGIAFFVLLGKALVETIQSIFLIIWGVSCYIVAGLLIIILYIINGFKKRQRTPLIPMPLHENEKRTRRAGTSP